MFYFLPWIFFVPDGISVIINPVRVQSFSTRRQQCTLLHSNLPFLYKRKLDTRPTCQKQLGIASTCQNDTLVYAVLAGVNIKKWALGHWSKGISALSLSLQPALPCKVLRWWVAHASWCRKLSLAAVISVNFLTRIMWPSEWSIALLNRRRQQQEVVVGLNVPKSARNSPGPSVEGCCRGYISSQWDSVLGQGSASGYDQLFKSFFWLSCPFSTMDAHGKAPADAPNVVTDYSWLTNRQAGRAPINRAGFSPMPRQGDQGVLTAGDYYGKKDVVDQNICFFYVSLGGIS